MGNLQGEVIGINTMKASAQGISFAIPIDMAMQVISQLRNNGRVVRPFVGMRMVSLDTAMITRERDNHPDDFPENVTWGVLLIDVMPGSPAHNAGLKPGDVLVRWGSSSLRSTKDLLHELGKMGTKEVVVEVRRGKIGALTKVRVKPTVQAR